MYKPGIMAEDVSGLKDFVNVNCNLCGSDDYEIYGRKQGTAEHIVHRTAVRCKKCSLVYSNPQATCETLQDFYSAVYPDLSRYLEHVEGLRSSHQAFFAKLNEGQGRRFLDVGCATGHLLRAGQEMGWEAYGVELSEPFSRYAREVLGLQNVFTSTLWEVHFPDRFFDYVNMWHTLEHVSDATRVLVEVIRIMKDDGELRIGVPNIAEPYQWIGNLSCWLKGKIPDMPSADHHTYHFTPSVLQKMVKKAGLRVHEMSLYYDPGTHDIADGTNWKGRLEKRLVSMLATSLPNRLGSKISVKAHKCD